MTKRKSSLQSTVASKKPRLDDADTIPDYIQTELLFMSLPMAPEPFKKRKRSDNPEAESESLEEPKARRIKTSDSQNDQTRDSRSLSPASGWSLLSDLSSEEDEGPDPEVEAFRRAYREAMAEGSPSQPLAPPNPLPSPELSDGDGAESDGTESDGTESDGTESDGPGLLVIPPVPKPSRPLSRQRPRRRDTTPPLGKRQQPPEKDKDENKRNKRQNNTPQHTIEAILRSKRSSRRDHNCKLWQLGDDSTAREVSKAR